MRLVKAIIVVALAISLAGCVVGAKPKTTPAVPAAPQPASAPSAPAPPEERLSIPQTQEKLPPVQPLDPEALVLAPPESAPESAPPPARNARNRTGSSSTTPKPETAPTVGPAAPAVEPRPPIQEMVPAAELKRLQDSANARKREIRQWLETRGRRRLKPQQQTIADRMRAFVKDSDTAERRGDMREADALAEKAQILLRELQNGQ